MTEGRVVKKVGDDVSTDIIYPGRFMATVLPSETPQLAFADDAAFNVALKSCGSSREQAASCLRGHDLVVVARDFARIFLQNGINLGLRVVICPTIEAEEGDILGFRDGAVVNRRTGRSYPVVPLPKARQAIIDAGGLVPYTRRLLLAKPA